ncbi:hypothetical protein CRENBAI_017619 [Crenichthys baileyi]|uniref:Uncharacterized protein n=1 Tax=Crenichthys baileyi TaxID=28760 RepID=A0AAV9RX58_9TELE
MKAVTHLALVLHGKWGSWGSWGETPLTSSMQGPNGAPHLRTLSRAIPSTLTQLLSPAGRQFDRAPCAARCQAKIEKESAAAGSSGGQPLSTKMNLHPLRATSRARFRPSSLSPCCMQRKEREINRLHTYAQQQTQVRPFTLMPGFL